MLEKDNEGFLASHGSYENLLSYRKAETVYDLTYGFCCRFLKRKDRTIIRWSKRRGPVNRISWREEERPGTSKEIELRQTGIARASLDELLCDYCDFLRTRKLRVWNKDSREALFVRLLGGNPDSTYDDFRQFCETRSAEVVANIAVCLVHQANHLLDQQIRHLEKDFLQNGGVRERMSRVRRHRRK